MRSSPLKSRKSSRLSSPATHNAVRTHQGASTVTTASFGKRKSRPGVTPDGFSCDCRLRPTPVPPQLAQGCYDTVNRSLTRPRRRHSRHHFLRQGGPTHDVAGRHTSGLTKPWVVPPGVAESKLSKASWQKTACDARGVHVTMRAGRPCRPAPGFRNCRCHGRLDNTPAPASSTTMIQGGIFQTVRSRKPASASAKSRGVRTALVQTGL